MSTRTAELDARCPCCGREVETESCRSTAGPHGLTIHVHAGPGRADHDAAEGPDLA